ncbi:hypothetical protein [Microcoleus sp. A003_D6]
MGLENKLADFWDSNLYGEHDKITTYFEDYLLKKTDCTFDIGFAKCRSRF